MITHLFGYSVPYVKENYKDVRSSYIEQFFIDG